MGQPFVLSVKVSFIPESWLLGECSCQGRVHTQKLYTEGSFADIPY